MKNKISEKITVLFIGFLLTTVCGAILGSYLQQRSWNNQWKIKKEEILIDQKKEIFQHISSLLDKRLYRTRQLLWSLQARFTEDHMKEKLQEYRKILYEWNENLNRNFALIQINFGKDTRDKFEHDIGKQFIDLGGKVEFLYRERMSGKQINIKEIDADLDSLHIKIYHFNLEMLTKIQEKIERLSKND